MSTWHKNSKRWQHKKALEALEQKNFTNYRRFEKLLALPPVEDRHEALADRFHYHLHMAELSRKEHRFFYDEGRDTPSNVPFHPFHVYLENIRSGYNVGNIVRTCEALRFGSIHFSPKTPTTHNKKVRDAAMGTGDSVPTFENATLDTLPKPRIALETIKEATPYYDYDFPERFTLLLGNEEYGLTQATLQEADAVITIPLFGTKNSLNVANAFAIVAADIIKSAHSR